LVKKDVPFGPRTAHRLMAIARHPLIMERTHVSILPPNWGTHYELTKLLDDVFEALISDGAIFRLDHFLESGSVILTNGYMAEVAIPRDLFADIMCRIDRLRPKQSPA
jgi:hypothetical protein